MYKQTSILYPKDKKVKNKINFQNKVLHCLSGFIKNLLFSRKRNFYFVFNFILRTGKTVKQNKNLQLRLIG